MHDSSECIVLVQLLGGPHVWYKSAADELHFIDKFRACVIVSNGVVVKNRYGHVGVEVDVATLDVLTAVILDRRDVRFPAMWEPTPARHTIQCPHVVVDFIGEIAFSSIVVETSRHR